MKLLFKILAAPVVVVLTVFVWLCALMLHISAFIFGLTGTVVGLRAGGAGHLLGEEWHHPSGDRVSGQPSRTSHAGGSDIGAVAGCKLCVAGFYKRLIENGGQLPFGGWPRFFFCRKLQKALVKSRSFLMVVEGTMLHF